MDNNQIYIPHLTSRLRRNYVSVPPIIQTASGINIFGKTIRSLIFTTDVAIIENTNADAVIAVYPFTPQPSITQALLTIADIPVLCGVGGGLTQGIRSADIALHAEFQGALGVVMNAPTPNETIQAVKERVDIPVAITIVSEHTNIQEKLDVGVDMLNVSGGSKTPSIVTAIRKSFPYIPIIATGGNTEESIKATIKAGANAISFTPPSTAELFKERMEIYRAEENAKYNK
ncbi:hydrolase [Irregularibacter muris]|uniref:Hydrolase n=1 Tax=Irregularibacter muris TaxID=1796619 RepID=A0AAE3KZN2_9FIRM|nr:hydrolase [Irregularibacter muris]MCR1898532.1 hydrolase [Irregularibacter muris]